MHALRLFRGIGVVVSHDRALLDALCANTVRLRSGKAELFRGGYQTSKATWW